MCTTCGCNDEQHDHAHSKPRDHDQDHDHEHDHEHDHHDHHDHTHDAPKGSVLRRLRLERELVAKNAGIAAENRHAFLSRRFAIFNLIGSPGAGKTALLETAIRRLLHDRVSLAVLEGDQATSRDAARIERAGGRVLQINTGTGCHLDATMVAHGVRALAPPAESIVFVENVGNLVCPALFDLGEHAKVTVMSVTEGEDKPLKYPHVFRAAEAFVLTKTDLIPHLQFEQDRCIAYARRINPSLMVFRTSAVTGDGVDELCRWLRVEAAGAWKAAQPS